MKEVFKFIAYSGHVVHSIEQKLLSTLIALLTLLQSFCALSLRLAVSCKMFLINLFDVQGAFAILYFCYIIPYVIVQGYK